MILFSYNYGLRHGDETVEVIDQRRRNTGSVIVFRLHFLQKLLVPATIFGPGVLHFLNQSSLEEIVVSCCYVQSQRKTCQHWDRLVRGDVFPEWKVSQIT